MNKIVLATLNEGKRQEMMTLLNPCPVTWCKLADFGLPQAEETGETFAENAVLKARYVASKTGLPALADDSGLEVDVLGGKPGVHSARYASENASAQDNITRLLEALTPCRKEVPLPRARFHAVMALVVHAHDPAPLLFTGCWEGHILPEPKGDAGFGYDPIFYVPTHTCSAAQLPWSVKAEISHRGKALQALLANWQQVITRFGQLTCHETPPPS